MAPTREKSDFKPGDLYRGFSVKRVESLESIRVKAFLIAHEKTGAEVLHLQCDDPENLFSVSIQRPSGSNAFLWCSTKCLLTA